MKKIINQLYKLRNKQASIERDLCNMILNSIDNDLQIPDEYIFVTYLAGDGFAFMIQTEKDSVPTGVGVEVVSNLIKSRKPDKIQISELVSIRSL